MPSKNKPKRLDRNRSSRVARRKRRIANRAEGASRSRGKRPKQKEVTSLLRQLDMPKAKTPTKKVEKKEEKKVEEKKSEEVTKETSSDDDK
jgi:hypothetical protein